MFVSIIKAFVTGIILAAPVGPVLIFVIQKTLCHSRKAGIYAGIGSACADTFYAIVAMLAVGLIRSFIEENADIIMIIGGALIAFVGLRMMNGKIDEERVKGENKSNSDWGYTLQTFLCAISNPAALAFATAAVAAWGIGDKATGIPFWAAAPLVFCGEVSYWCFITFLLKKIRKVSGKMLQIFSAIAGGVIAVLGIVLAAKGLISLL